MKLLLDETLGRSVVSILSGGGHDVARSSAVGGPGLSDDELLETAATENRVLVTLDEGFANPVRFDPSGRSGIVVITLPDDASSDWRAPTDEMQKAVVDTRRAIADLATEGRRLDAEIPGLLDRKARLRLEVASAQSQGRDNELRDLLEKVVAVEADIDRLRARRAGVATQEEDTRAIAADLADRVRAAKTQLEVDRAELHLAGGETDDRAALGLEQLLPVWGSLARDLASALSGLLAALEGSDPRGQLWVAGVDGVKRYRDSE